MMKKPVPGKKPSSLIASATLGFCSACFCCSGLSGKRTFGRSHSVIFSNIFPLSQATLPLSFACSSLLAPPENLRRFLYTLGCPTLWLVRLRSVHLFLPQRRSSLC